MKVESLNSKIQGIKGINLIRKLDTLPEHLIIKGDESQQILKVPFAKISNSAVYNTNEVEIQMPFNDISPNGVTLCEARFIVPPLEVDNDEAKFEAETLANTISQAIRKKAHGDKETGELIATLDNLPLSVPRGRYTVDFYTRRMRLHGTTFNYMINYRHIKKAFLLPMIDDVHTSLVVGFDPNHPLRQGTTLYPYMIFHFKIDSFISVTTQPLKDEHKLNNGKLNSEYSGQLHEVVAKLIKNIIGVNIIIPGDFRSAAGKSAVKCNIGSSSGLLFPLMTSLIYIKRPIMFIRIKDISRVEFRRVSLGHSVRNFDFEIVMKSGKSQVFSNCNRAEYEILTVYFERNKVMTRAVKDTEDSDGEISEDDNLKTKGERQGYDRDFVDNDGYGDDDEDDDMDYQEGM